MFRERERSEVMRKLCALAAEQVEVDAAEVLADTDFFVDLGFDSLDAAEYAMRVEDEFEVSVPDEVAQQLRTPAQVYDALRALPRDEPREMCDRAGSD